MKLIKNYVIPKDIGYHGPDGMRTLAEKLNTELSEALENEKFRKQIIYYGDNFVTIKADKNPSNPTGYIMHFLRKIRDIPKKPHKKYSDLHIEVIVGTGFAEVNLYDPERWKEPIYKIVMDFIEREANE